MQYAQCASMQLDEQALVDMAAEQRYHTERIAEIATRQAAGAWAYTLSDENERHARLLNEIFLAARKRSLGTIN